jgi:hypothetical protein
MSPVIPGWLIVSGLGVAAFTVAAVGAALIIIIRLRKR